MSTSRVAIIGAGGIGGYLGVRLAQADHDVAFLARGAHLQAMREKGLLLRDEGEEDYLQHPAVFSDTRDMGNADLILFCVKMTDAEVAARACAPLVGDNTALVTFQNGVEAASLVSNVLPNATVLPGVGYIVTQIAEPGVIEKTGPAARFEISSDNSEDAVRAEEVVRLLAEAKIDAHYCQDAQVMLWRKFVMLAATSSMTAFTRKPMGHMQTNPEAQAMMVAALREGIAVARALDIDLDEDIEALVLHRINKVMHADAKASQLIDLERGKPLELHWLSGTIHRLGQETGVPTPVHSMVYHALLPYAGGNS